MGILNGDFSNLPIVLTGLSWWKIRKMNQKMEALKQQAIDGFNASPQTDADLEAWENWYQQQLLDWSNEDPFYAVLYNLGQRMN